MMTASPFEIRCPACGHSFAPSAGGGRIRLTEETAMLMEALLVGARRQGVRARRRTIDSHDEAGQRETDRQLGLIKMTLEEIHRTQTEKGWPSLGQLQRSHPA
jgi:hypothetical protein